MPLVVPPGFGSAAFVLTGAAGTQPYITTIGVDLSQAGGDFVGAANSAMIAYTSAFANATNQSLVVDHVTLRVGQDGPGGSVDSDMSAVPCTQTASMAPTAMSVILRKVTNDIGRKGRGRMFLPGIVREDGVDSDGGLTAGFRSAMAVAAQDFLLQLGTGGGAGGTIPLLPVVLHSDATPPTPITNVAISDLVGWIRGRIR